MKLAALIAPLVAGLLLGTPAGAQQERGLPERPGPLVEWRGDASLRPLVGLGAYYESEPVRFPGWRYHVVVSAEEEPEALAALERIGADTARVVFHRSFPPAPPSSPPPPGPVSMVAEWEPALGAAVGWPLDVPDALLVEIARDDLLFVCVAPPHLDAAREHVLALDVDPERVRFVPAGFDSLYPRDYGPHQIVDGTGKLAVLDTFFAGYPYYPAEAQDPPRATYNFYTGAGSDALPRHLARFLELPVHGFPAILTGGNFLVDGAGAAFATRAQLDENLPVVGPDELSELLLERAGIERFHVLDNTESLGIQHIDCWMKPLDEERLLVKRAPEGHPEAARIERNLTLLANAATAFGKPYEVLRIDCPAFGTSPGFGDPPIAAYTNSLILNDKVLVPLFGVEGDGAALETWRSALPGYEVVGFRHDTWRSFDALHCRVRAIHDPEMLRLRYSRREDGSTGHVIDLRIEPLGGATVDPEESRIEARPVGDGEWSSRPLEHEGGSRWTGRWDLAEDGPPFADLEYRILEYRVVAVDSRGRRATLPRGERTFRMRVYRDDGPDSMPFTEPPPEPPDER